MNVALQACDGDAFKMNDWLEVIEPGFLFHLSASCEMFFVIVALSASDLARCSAV
jgi:hypothetical protein